jgi:DNA-binding transcriptional ArsR family regulator
MGGVPPQRLSSYQKVRWHADCATRGNTSPASGVEAYGTLIREGERMSSESPRSRLSSPRVRTARDALLNSAAAALLRPVREVICEPTRTQIVRALGAGPLSVGDLAAILGRSKSATSQHLRVLRDGGIVSARRRGRAVIYSLTTGPMVEVTVQMLNRAASIAAA